MTATASPAGTPLRVVGQAGEHRLAGIEGLRAVGAVGVFVAHVYLLWWQRASSPGDGLAHRLLLGTGIGYQLLFALSGYLLFRPFVRQLMLGEAVDLRRYARNRALRVLPLYYVAVVVLLLTLGRGSDPGRWLVLLTLTGNAVPGSYQGLNTPLLMLLVEVQFYVVLPFLAPALLAGRSVRRCAVLIGAASTVSLGLYVGVPALTALPDPQRWIRASLLTTFFLFGAGMLLALVEHTWRERPGRGAGSAQAWLLAAVAAWVAASVARLDVLGALASFLLIGACVLPLRTGPLTRALSARPLALVGVATFSLYMWHAPIVQTVAAGAWAPRDFLGLLAVTAVLCAAATVVSYALVEASALPARRTWAPSTPRADGRPGPPGRVLARALPRILAGAVLLGALLACLDALA